MKIEIPYYKTIVKAEIDDSRIAAVIEARQDKRLNLSEIEIVETAMLNPVKSKSLDQLSKGKKNILIITSDHTRPVPSKITMPILLKHIRKNNPDAKIKILIATGLHRPTTKEEIIEKFGKSIADKEEFIIHNASNKRNMVFKGILPSGGKLYINKLVDWSELTVAEGFIEPHFFAGFSGGRKSILPGICSEKTIMHNHNSTFIADINAKAGRLEENPIHKDMVFAAEKVGLSFILNVCLDKNKKITHAYAGDKIEAHLNGCREVFNSSSVKAIKAPIVITSNGGYPLDQNIYQSVKGMYAAEICVAKGGIIIIAASCCKGHGGESFYRWFKDSNSAKEVWDKIISIKPKDTLPDQWQAQILAGILKKVRAVIIVSNHIEPQLIKDMQMLHAKTIEEAVSMADKLLGKEKAITVIPDGVGIIFG